MAYDALLRFGPFGNGIPKLLTPFELPRNKDDCGGRDPSPSAGSGWGFQKKLLRLGRERSGEAHGPDAGPCFAGGNASCTTAIV
jgi:hypothetical protein